MKTIFGVQVKDRHSKASDVQKLLTENGCLIKTRIGLHDVHQDHCSKDGVIVLELLGEEKEIEEFEKKLKDLGLIVKKMVFE
ncbi:MAG: hypothetical protein ACQEP1_00990 [Nanobdellota archaeon]